MSNFVVLALGSNLGDRKKNITDAYLSLCEILKIKSISFLYKSKALLPKDANENWDIDFYNSVICGPTELQPFELHKKILEIEAKIGKDHTLANQWAPRIIDIDILAYNDEIIKTDKLIIPHPRMLERDFVILPLNEILPNWVHPVTKQKISDIAEKNFQNSKIEKIESNKKTKFQAIVNITPDSFSDSKASVSFETANTRIKELIKAGASIIDIGAESTRPGAEIITLEEEFERLKPVLEKISDYNNVQFSLDSRNFDTQRKATKYSNFIINDVSGFSDEKMINFAKERGSKIIFMHSLSIPADKLVTIPDDADAFEIVYKWAEDKINQLENFGIEKNKMIFDPGLGFGKTREQSWYLIKRIEDFKSLGVRMLVGHSEKSFLTLFTDKPAGERLEETLMLSKILIAKDIDYLRVHNIKAHKALL